MLHIYIILCKKWKRRKKNWGKLHKNRGKRPKKFRPPQTYSFGEKMKLKRGPRGGGSKCTIPIPARLLSYKIKLEGVVRIRIPFRIWLRKNVFPKSAFVSLRKPYETLINKNKLSINSTILCEHV